MRPVRLELHGFTAFREPTVVDFDGADLFALSGPTGAGKSSVIDGMCFALYGSVPRLDKGRVAPIVSTGKVEARIRFDFTVGERAFTAVRVVRRTASGATTKEARLESDGQTVAGDADGMTAAVERLLGLGFEQFTKCVVLPQGDFARFLHDKPSARQELLVKLLDLGVYEWMRLEANNRRLAAEAAVELAEQQLAALADATPEVLQVAADRVERLSALREEIDEAQPAIDEAEAQRRTAEQQRAEAHTAATALRGVAVPEGIAELASSAAVAEQAVVTAQQETDAAQAAAAAAEQTRHAAGDATALRQIAAQLQERAELRERIAKGGDVVAQRRTAEESAAAAAAEAAAALEAAQAQVQRARRDHAAHALAASLELGAPCPVCLHPVDTLPQHPAAPGLDEAEQRHRDAVAAHDKAVQAAAPLAPQRAKAEQLLESLTEQLAAADARLADAPTAEEIANRLAAIGHADAALQQARTDAAEAARVLQAAQHAAQQAAARRDGAWAAFDRARDGVAAFGPPPVDRADLAGAWTMLARWCATEAATADQRAADAASRAAQAAADLEAIATKIAARCDECEVVVAKGTRPRDAVADAVAAAQAEHRRIADAITQAEQLRAAVATHRDAAAVAKTLAKHLSARGFEQWLLDEALTRLAQGASTVLRELSAGQYSLVLDGQRNFAVVDHRNADEERPARTLSGGETFLASLALALSLADHLLQLSVAAEPRLESIFLDEGFGSLDPETLDVVAAAIEELGARGRTVGLVTHVRDLAERMPVRFEVRKGLAGSSVERVER